MATTTITLKHGLKLGEVPQLEAVLRQTDAGIVIDACSEAERLVLTDDGWQLVQSPTMVGAHSLRRQIVRIGEIKGPLELSQLKLLHPEDFTALQAAAQALDSAALGAALKGVAQAGRGHAASSGS